MKKKNLNRAEYLCPLSVVKKIKEKQKITHCRNNSKIAANTNFMVFGLIRQKLEPKIYHTRGLLLKLFTFILLHLVLDKLHIQCILSFHPYGIAVPGSRIQ